MRRVFIYALAMVMVVCLMGGNVWAEDEDVDITEDVLTGPGDISISTEKDILMSFGATTRIIPTSESNWDFGMSDDNKNGYLGGALKDSFFKNHVNESGWVNNNYIRTETKLHFNALPKNRKWSFYAALEFDRPLETASVDERGGKTDSTSDFGLERLHGTYALPWNMRLHAGWDVWGVDIIDAAGLVYGDDNPGFWLTGEYDTWSFNVAYFKLQENNFQISPLDLEDTNNDDRDLYAGYVTYEPTDEQKVQFFYTYDRIRDIQVRDFINYFSDGQVGLQGKTPETDSHHVGAYYTGTFGMLELFAEGVYQYGQADDTGLSQYGLDDDYDISAYAFAGDVALNMEDMVGFSFKPHAGFMYTSGDDDADDDELGGYTGNENAQRFSKYWGGENTIIADTNFVYGSMLYGYLPEIYGNGTPVFTGGLQNTSGIGAGRGDNPGLTMTSFGLSATPKRFLIFRSNVNSFWWNEDFEVQSFSAPVNPQTGQKVTTKVDSGYVGTEWDNELTFAMSKNTFIKGQCSFFFPGTGIEDVTSALSATPAGPGEESDDIASRIAAEFIWNF